MDERINTKTAAGLLGWAHETLKRRRTVGYKGPDGPPWHRVAGRIFYLRHEVEAFASGVVNGRGPQRSMGPRVPPPPPLTPSEGSASGQ